MYPIYLNNALATSITTEDNLRTLTKLYDNGQRSNSQIFAMLRGLGIPENKAVFAVENYVNNKKNIPNTMHFTLEKLTNLLLGLKRKLSGLKESDATRINYSADNSLRIVEGILANIYEYTKVFESIQNANTPEQAIEYASKINPIMLKIKPEVYYSVTIAESLEQYRNIVAINEILNSINSFIKENKYTTKLTKTLFSINGHDDSKYYNECAEDITHLLKRDESFIKENINVVLNKHAWIPAVKTLLESYSASTNKYVSGDEASVERVYSPVFINEDKSVTIYLDNNFYNIKGQTFEQLTDPTKITSDFYKMCTILEHFKFENNELTLYKPNSSLKIVVESNAVKINGISVDKTNVQSLRNTLISSNFYRIDEINKVERLLLLLENFNTIKEIDIITRLVGRNGNIVNIVKLDEKNIYINRYNESANRGEIFKVTDYNQAQSIVNEYFNFDISRSMEHIIENTKYLKNNLISQKTELENRIKFLTERIDLFTKEGIILNDVNIENALTLLKSERRNFEIELQSIYEKLTVFTN